PAPQAVDPARGVVCPKAENGLRMQENGSDKPILCVDFQHNRSTLAFQFPRLLVRIAFPELDQRFHR
ncbi:MAG: hypothetical protein WCE63_06920, partial [Acidobacteriaceae bacterium]